MYIFFFLCENKTCFLHLKSDLIPHSKPKATVLYIKKFLTPSPSLIHFSFRKKRVSEGALMFTANSLLPCNHGNVMRQGLA